MQTTYKLERNAHTSELLAGAVLHPCGEEGHALNHP